MYIFKKSVEVGSRGTNKIIFSELSTVMHYHAKKTGCSLPSYLLSSGNLLLPTYLKVLEPSILLTNLNM